MQYYHSAAMHIIEVNGSTIKVMSGPHIFESGPKEKLEIDATLLVLLVRSFVTRNKACAGSKRRKIFRIRISSSIVCKSSAHRRYDPALDKASYTMKCWRTWVTSLFDNFLGTNSRSASVTIIFYNCDYLSFNSWFFFTFLIRRGSRSLRPYQHISQLNARVF